MNNNNMEKNIEIVGAGPAGMVAAINLVRTGYEVTLYEQHPDVGHRFNGDFQGLENWTTEYDVRTELFEMGIEINFFCQPYYGGELYGPNLKKVEIKSKEPLFYLVKRGSEPGTLDQGLKEQAIKAGVDFRFNHKVEKLKGRTIVGTGPKAADAIAVGLIFETDHEDVAATIFDNNLAPEGYAYLLIHQGRGTIASCMFRDYSREKESVKRTIETFTDIYHLNMRKEREFGGFGNFFFPKSLVRNEKLYVGENAGFQDFLWGFGMRYAMTSGSLAAKSIVDGVGYDYLCRNVIYPKLKTAVSNRYLFKKAGNRGYQILVNRIERTDDARVFLMKNYNPSLFKKLVFPFAMRDYKSRVKDKSCSHDNCTCTWCRGGKKETTEQTC